MKLPAVKFSKVTRGHACELQALVVFYMLEQEKDLDHGQLSVRFHSAIQEMALCVELYLVLRKCLESRKEKFSLSLKCEQAVTLMFACCSGYKNDQSYMSTVALLYQNHIDNQLKSINKAGVAKISIATASLLLINS